MRSSESIHWVLQVFSPTYYSSSFATALPHSRKAFCINCSFAMKMVCSTHSPIVCMYQPNIHLHLYLPEQISLFCRGTTVRCVLHLQASCKKTPKSRQISCLLHLSQKPRQLLHNLQFAPGNTATAIILVYVIFNLEDYVKTKPKPNKTHLDFS